MMTDRALRRLRAAVRQARAARDAEDVPRIPARHADHPGRDDQRRPAGLVEFLTRPAAGRRLSLCTRLPQPGITRQTRTGVPFRHPQPAASPLTMRRELRWPVKAAWSCLRILSPQRFSARSTRRGSPIPGSMAARESYRSRSTEMVINSSSDRHRRLPSSRHSPRTPEWRSPSTTTPSRTRCRSCGTSSIELLDDVVPEYALSATHSGQNRVRPGSARSAGSPWPASPSHRAGSGYWVRLASRAPLVCSATPRSAPPARRAAASRPGTGPADPPASG